MGRFKIVTLKLVKDIRGRVFQEIYEGKKLLSKSTPKGEDFNKAVEE